MGVEARLQSIGTYGCESKCSHLRNSSTSDSNVLISATAEAAVRLFSAGQSTFPYWLSVAHISYAAGVSNRLGFVRIEQALYVCSLPHLVIPVINRL
jgi:hypothetical protein